MKSEFTCLHNITSFFYYRKTSALYKIYYISCCCQTQTPKKCCQTVKKYWIQELLISRQSTGKLVKQNYNILLMFQPIVKKPYNPNCRAVIGWNISRRSEFLSHRLSGRLAWKNAKEKFSAKSSYVLRTPQKYEEISNLFLTKNFMNSEKATKVWRNLQTLFEIALYVTSKKGWRFLHIFVAFSEYMNFMVLFR